MPSDRWFHEGEIAFRAHATVLARYRNANDAAVLDVELRDGTLLSVLDPDDRYPADLVGESRTLAFAVEGFPAVRPAEREQPVLEVPDEGRLDVVGLRTSHCSWDGETVTVPIEAGGDAWDVPVRETGRPRFEAGAASKVVEEEGIGDCEYVAVDGARVTLHAVDLDVETDPWAGVVFEDVTFEIDTDDESFLADVRQRSSTVAAPMGIAFGPRWFYGDADAFKIHDIMVDGHVSALMTTLGRVLDGETATHKFMGAPIQYEFEPAGSGAMRFNLVDDRGRCLDSRFPPDGVLVDAGAFVAAVVDAARDMIRRVEELNPAASDQFDRVEASADALERELGTHDTP